MNLFLVVGLVAVAASVATAIEFELLRIARSPHHRKDGRSNSYTHTEDNASASGYAEKTTNTKESEKLHRGYDRGVFTLVDRRHRGKGILEGSHGTGLQGASESSITDSGISTGISGSLDSHITSSKNEQEKQSLSNSSTVSEGNLNCIDVRGSMYTSCTGSDVPNSSTVINSKAINRGTGISSGSNSDHDNAHIVGHQFPNVGIGSIDSDVTGSDGETDHNSSHRVPPNSGGSESGYEANTVSGKPNPGGISSGSSHEFDGSNVKGESSIKNNNENSSLPSSSTVNNGKPISGISSGSTSDDNNAHIVGHQFPNVGIGSLDSHITGSQNEREKPSLSNSSTVSQGNPNCIDVRGFMYTSCTETDVPNSSTVINSKAINRGTGISSGSNSDHDNAHIVGHQFPNVGIGSIDSDVIGSDGEIDHNSSHRVPPNSGRSESGYEANTVSGKPNPGGISSGSSHEFDGSSVEGESSIKNNNENSSLPSSSTVNNGKPIFGISSGSTSDDNNAHIVGHQFPNVGIGSLDSHITGSQNEREKPSLSNSSTVSQGNPNCIDVRGFMYTSCTETDVPNSSMVINSKAINRGTGISSESNSDHDNAHIVGHQFPNVGIGSIDSDVTGSDGETDHNSSHRVPPNSGGSESGYEANTVSGKPNPGGISSGSSHEFDGSNVKGESSIKNNNENSSLPSSSTVNNGKPISGISSGSTSDDNNAHIVGHQFPNVGIGSLDSHITGSQNEREKPSLSNSSTVSQGNPNCIDVRGFMYTSCTETDVPNSSTVINSKAINRGTGIRSGSNSDDDNAHIVGHQFPNVGIGSIDSDVIGSDGEIDHNSSHRVPPNSGRSESGYEANTVSGKPNPGGISSGSSHEFDGSSVEGESSIKNNNENSSLPSSSTVNNGKPIFGISSGSTSDDNNAHIVGHQFPNVGIGSLDSHITGSQNEREKPSLSNSSTVSEGNLNCIDVRGSMYTSCTGSDVPNSSTVINSKAINRGTGISSGSNSDHDNAHIVGHQFPNVGIGSLDSHITGSQNEREKPSLSNSSTVSQGNPNCIDVRGFMYTSCTETDVPNSSTVINNRPINRGTGISSGSNSDDDNAHIVGHQFPNVGIGSIDSDVTGSDGETDHNSSHRVPPNSGRSESGYEANTVSGKPNPGGISSGSSHKFDESSVKGKSSIKNNNENSSLPSSGTVNNNKPITGISSGSNSFNDNAHIVGHQFPNVGIGSLDSHITGSQYEGGKDNLSNSSTVSHGKPNCIDVRGFMYTHCTGVDLKGTFTGSSGDRSNTRTSSRGSQVVFGTGASGYIPEDSSGGAGGENRGGHQDSSSFSSSSSISPNYSFSSTSGNITQPFGYSSMASSGGIWHLQ